jgi:adenosylcobinamide kinase/adenosylcobinamide-phosphate guanylyltransferase
MRTLVIGGSASGKSEYAEALALQSPCPKYYIATLMAQDDESLKRIAKHRQMRAEKSFVTIERYNDLGGLMLPKRGTVLLECLGNLTANELFCENGAAKNTFNVILDGCAKLEKQCDELIVVSNDVFRTSDVYDEGMLYYMEMLGLLNRALAARFERVVETVCGIAVPQKGVCS